MPAGGSGGAGGGAGTCGEDVSWKWLDLCVKQVCNMVNIKLQKYIGISQLKSPTQVHTYVWTFGLEVGLFNWLSS